MADDNLLPPEDKSPKRITCDFCGCQLDRSGGVLRTGDRAKLLRKMEDAQELLANKLETLQGEVTRLGVEIDARDAEIVRLKAPAPAGGSKRRDIFSDDE